MKNNSDSGNLSIDFLVGFTIFLLAFIWVVSMIPGLLINLQGYTIDYDAVTYRTGVILAEDPGEPSLPTSINPWESLLSSQGVVRFGLAESKDTPMILSQRKVESFFCLSTFSYPVDYQSRTIFGDYPYQFNISLIEIGSAQPPRYVGDIMPATSTYGSIRRLVKIKQPAIAIINASYNIAHPDYFSGDNETVHEFIVLINKSELFADKVRNQIYQIDPSREKTIINITNLNQTMYPDRTQCFNINLTKITIINDMNGVIVRPPIPNYKSVIDGIEYNQSSPLPYIKYNISLIFDPPTYWSVTDKSYINLTFNLVKNTNTTECPPSNPAYNFTGSRFLNNTFTSPFGYNYSPKNVIQPKLQDAVLEIRVGSGARNVTETLIAKLAAAFTTDLSGGLSVAFKDTSTGNPVEWDWDFGDGTSHGTTNNPTHTYASQGIKTVTLIIKDTNGVSDSVTKTIDLSAPVAGFIGAPLSGNEPLNVQFTDTSTGGVPTSWKWEFNETSGGGWTQFNTTIQPNPWNTFTEGTYDIRLTATNVFGSNIKTIYSYISVIPPPPVASFNTTPSPATGPAPLAVTFTDTSTGGTPTLWDWDFGDGSPHSYNVTSIAHTYNVAGPYTAQLTVSNAGGSSSATKPVSVNIVPAPTVTSITPNTGLNTTTIGITNLAGTGFLAGATVKLNRTGYSDIPGTSVTVVSPNQITCTFDLTNKKAGLWNVAVVNADGQSGVLANGFTITAPQKQIFDDNFESGFTGWTIVGAVTRGSYTPRNGSYDIRLRAPATVTNATMTRAISTLGYSSVGVQFAWAASSLEAGELLYAEYSTDGGSNWIILTSITNTASLTVYSSALPVADNNANFQASFPTQSP